MVARLPAAASLHVHALVGHNHMSVCTALSDAKSEPMRLILGQMGLE